MRSGICLALLCVSVVSVGEAVEVGGAATNVTVSAAIPYAPPQYRRPTDWKPGLWTQDLATVSRIHSARVMDLARAQMEKVDAANRSGRYRATGASLDAHRCPEWLQDAKLGIFVDWGPWSVASWAPYAKGGRFYPDGYENHCEFPLGSEPAERDALFRAYHLKNWGADFHRDHFLALFRAEAFDADGLVRLFRTCGAKYVVPFLKHHGGYCLWDCPYTFRDSVDQGPRRDLAREMREACRREDLKFGFYFSHGLEWGYPVLNGDGSLGFVNAAGQAPAPYRPEMEWTASGKVAVKDFVRDYTVPQATDFIDRYDPDLLWYDGDWVSSAAVNGGYDIAAYFYNRAEGRKEVAVNDRYGFGTPDEVAHKRTTRGGVYEKFLRAVRGDFYTSETADIAEDLDPASGHLWEECHGITHAYGNHWQEDGTTVMGERELIAYFTDIVARGGNLLLMVNLDGQGRLPGLQRQRLMTLGGWLSRWGGAIYGTRACAPYSTPEAGYLRSKDGSRRFAVILDGRREIELKCAFAPDEEVRVFGEREALPVRTDPKGRRLVLIPPRWTMSELPYVLEIAKPAPRTPPARAWRIDSSAQPQPWERTAAAELELWLGEVTSNGYLRVAGCEDVVLHVGDTDFAKAKGLASPAFKGEEWCVKSFGCDVVLNGGGTRGCLYAVSHFLEDDCGVRWWEDGDTDCPSGATLSFDSLDRRGRPFFTYREVCRRFGVVADYRTAVRLRLNGNGYGKIPRSWGGGVEYGPLGPAHAWDRLLPFAKYGKEHPEWYSLIDGRREGGMYVGQLCLSNPELVPVMVEKMEEVIARGKALAAEQGINPPRLHALNMNDNKRFCECPKCAEEIARYGHSGQQLRFVNAIAAVLGKRHPELLFKFSAYLYAEEPPKGGVRAADNVLVNWCNTRSSYVSSISSARNSFLWEMSAKWAPYAKERCLWDYMTTFDPTTYGWPYPSEVWYGEKFRYYAKLGVGNIVLEHEMPETADLYEYKLFLERHLVEDPQADVAALTDEFMTRYYGAGAGAEVRRSREILARVCAEGKGDVSWCPRRTDFRWLTDAAITDIQACFNRAEELASPDPVRLERVRRARSSIDRVADCRCRLRLCAGTYPAEELAPQDLRHMKLVGPEGGRVLEIDATSARCDRAHFRRAGCSNKGPQFELSGGEGEAEGRWSRYVSPVFTLNDGYVHFLDWQVQLETGLPDFVGRRVRLSVEVKLTGPKFFAGSKEPDRIFVKSVALVPEPEEAPPRPPADTGRTAFRVLPESSVRDAVEAFNAADDELYTNAYPNAVAADLLATLVPRFECPDADITRTYYFRWWTYRKHLRRGSRDWVVTEFLPDVPWAGKDNTIACPFGHHVREGRWLRDAAYLTDHLRFMMKEGRVSGPGSYACWPAVSACDLARVTGDWSAAERLLPDFLAHYEAWEHGWKTSSHSLRTVENRQGARGTPFTAGFRCERGLFDLPGNAEGSECALSADGARVLVNAAFCAEARAIAQLARRTGNAALAARFDETSAALERTIAKRLWNPEKRFFCTLDVAGRLDDVRELSGYAPWYFGLPSDPSRDIAFAALGETSGFAAPKGLAFVARETPGFDLSVDDTRHECLWNGPSWPYSTSLALTALANRLQTGAAPAGAPRFADLLAQYARQHRLVRADGRVVPWIDENLDPMTGEWLARNALEAWRRKGMVPPPIVERGKDYNHSTFCDLVIAGLCGIAPREDGSVEVKPLAPPEWDWWCVDGVRVQGRDVTVLFDRDGSRYGKGRGLVVLPTEAKGVVL